jgi:hypothetical protein
MRTLADSYVVAQDRFPPTPGGTTPTLNGTGPGTGVTTTGAPVVTDANGMPILLSDPTRNPSQTPGGATIPGQQNQASSSLFGDMFTVGLAAAAAAAGGKFAGGLTGGRSGAGLTGAGALTGAAGTTIAGKLTPVANPNGSKDDKNKAATADAAGVLGSKYLAGKLGAKFGGGGGSIGGVGGLGGLGAAPSGVKAVADAANSLTAAAANDFAGGALGAGGAAAAAAGRGGMMPMMPMSGMGGGMGGDANRRIPAWLVETEDVWGASAPVSPGVIGGDL